MAIPNVINLNGSIFFTLLLMVVSPCAAYAGVLEKTCDQVHQKLASGPYESLTNSFEDFTDEGRSYHGCAMRLSGDSHKITGLTRS